MILIQLGEHGGDLALAEGAVERIVDSGDGQTEPRCRVAVDGDPGLQAVILLVRAEVDNLRQFAQARHHLGRPFVELLEVFALERVLVGGATHAAADLDILHGPQEKRRAGHAGGLSAEARHHRPDGHLAHIEVFERDEHTAGVGSPAAGKGHHAIHGRIGHDGVDEAGGFVAHGLEGDVLPGLDHARNASGVLLREEAFGHDHVQIYV